MDREHRDELERKATLAIHDAEDLIMSGEYSKAIDNLRLAYRCCEDLGGHDRGPLDIQLHE